MNGVQAEQVAEGAVNVEPKTEPAVPVTTSESQLPVSAPSISDAPEIPSSSSTSTAPIPAVDVTTSVVQQPTSDVREEAQPLDPERGAEIKEQKQAEDLVPEPVAPEAASEVIPETIPEPVSDVAQDMEASIPETSSAPLTESAAPTQVTSGSEEAEAQSSVDKVAEIASADVADHPPAPISEGTAPEAPLDPAPSPAAKAENSVTAPPENDGVFDQVMEDVPASSTKVAREREEDDDNTTRDEPSAKRPKTQDDAEPAADFKKPEKPIESGEPTQPAKTEAVEDSAPMTRPQQKHILKTLGNVKRIHAAKMFIIPVDHIALNLPSYPTIVTRPMDLKTLEDNVRSDQYPTVAAAVADFNQIVENSRKFNGPEHPVTLNALAMKGSFDKGMEKVPAPDIAEPVANDRKKKVADPAPVKIPPARRESRSSLPGSARSPVSAGEKQTFALSPEGVPLIRRDSTVDGRPKREIHRPAPRDLPYSNQKPKKKKYQWELKFCEKVLAELNKPKYATVNYPFMTPVDPVALNIPTYHSIVKKPMDFGTMKQKLDRGEYENAKDFESDVRLVFQNCYKFNPPGDIIHNTGKEFERTFDAEWSKKKEWLENNTPASGPQSPGSSPDPEESEDEEEEEEEEEDEDQSQLSKLQQHIAALSKQVEMIQKKKKSPPAPSKKSSKPKPAKKEGKKANSAAPAKTEKKSASKTKKEKVPTVTYEQKQDISMRINSLPEAKMSTALKIIRDNMPNLKVSQRRPPHQSRSL